MLKWIKRAMCERYGHKYTINGVTGRYKWCGRCGYRHDNGSSTESGEAAARIILAALKQTGY